MCGWDFFRGVRGEAREGEARGFIVEGDADVDEGFEGVEGAGGGGGAVVRVEVQEVEESFCARQLVDCRIL